MENLERVIADLRKDRETLSRRYKELSARFTNAQNELVRTREEKRKADGGIIILQDELARNECELKRLTKELNEERRKVNPSVP